MAALFKTWKAEVVLYMHAWLHEFVPFQNCLLPSQSNGEESTPSALAQIARLFPWSYPAFHGVPCYIVHRSGQESDLFRAAHRTPPNPHSKSPLAEETSLRGVSPT